MNIPDIITFKDFETTCNFAELGIYRVIIWPDDAKEILDRNVEGNRSVAKKRVIQYAFDMKHGEWNDRVGNFIRFDTAGRLIDGQHRMLAVIEANMSVVFWVVTGQGKKEFRCIDNGRSRNLYQFLQGENYANARNAEAVARALIMLDESMNLKSVLVTRGSGLNFAVITRAKLFNFLDENRDYIDWLSALSKKMAQSAKCGACRSYSLFIHAASKVSYKDKALAFIDDFCAGDGIAGKAKSALMSKKLQKALTDAYTAGTLFQAFWQYPNSTITILNKQSLYIDKYTELYKRACKQQKVES